MVGKEVRIQTKDGLEEAVICWDFRVGVDQGVPALMMRMDKKQMYVVPLEKIAYWEANFVWIFDEFGPPMPPPSINA